MFILVVLNLFIVQAFDEGDYRKIRYIDRDKEVSTVVLSDFM